MPALKRLRMKEYEPQASLGYTTRYLKKPKSTILAKKNNSGCYFFFFKREDKPDVVFMSAIPGEAETGGSL